ncbi:MAG TPA: methyltransferase, partial [Anaeromyxobacteraceae bacterium]|nr:methyltransferase [Anaeromyxobacteraceae bacterium]
MRRQVKAPAVSRELAPGQSTALLKELHLLTREGDLNADSLRKLKQVNHLVRLLAPAVEDVLARFGEPVLVDCGAGKGYLGF